MEKEIKDNNEELNNNEMVLIDDSQRSMWQNAIKFSKAGDMIPKHFIGNPHKIYAALVYGKEIGLKLMQSLQSIYVIGGKVALYGDVIKGLCIKTGEVEDIKEYVDEAGNNVCLIKRKGYSEVRGVYTKEQYAKNKKKNDSVVWQNYPDRMRQLKARNFACRDAFPDVMAGIYDREADFDELRREINITPQKEKNNFSESTLNAIQNTTKQIEEPETIINNDPVYAEIEELFEKLGITNGEKIELKSMYPDTEDLRTFLYQKASSQSEKEDKKEITKPAQKRATKLVSKPEKTNNNNEGERLKALSEFEKYINDNGLNRDEQFNKYCKYSNSASMADADPDKIISYIKFEKSKIKTTELLKKTNDNLFKGETNPL